MPIGQAESMTESQQCHFAGETEDADSAGDEGQSELIAALACNACRKRKLRCSREVPICQHCRRTVQCVYEKKRNKPGLKPGALEKVHRRLDALERTVHQREQESRSGTRPTRRRQEPKDRTASEILNLLARELPKLVEAEPECDYSRDGREESRSRHSHQKRRRIDGSPGHTTIRDDEEGNQIRSRPLLPSSDCLHAILRAYFECVHPWIPMVHQARLRARLADPLERPKLDVLLQAIVLAASRFVSNQDVLGASHGRSRSWVVTTAMDDMTIESLQALIIVAFNDIGNGGVWKAWSLVGAMTAIVDYLQLTVEHEDNRRQPLCQSLVALPRTDNWTENEERRRVFWNVFSLDRFCSVATGLNTSLSSDNVHRRLPCDGILWRLEDPVRTPFFGIWDKAAARTGNRIAFLSPHSDAAASFTGAPAKAGGPQGWPDAISPSGPADANEADMLNVGAYGYCIEATESMSRVMSYFLQQPLDPSSPDDIRQWLTRFKELDLRLVHWKMLLPQRWKADSYLESRAAAPLVMDPNLTLAHVTHNTSMILLHQLIAFPPPSLSAAFRSATQRLQSAYSAETCVAAATEISVITSNYLKSTPAAGPVASQYAFCVYIAARTLLVHWRSSSVETELGEEFWELVGGLEAFSDRWSGYRSTSEGEATGLDLAQRYSEALRQLHARCASDKGFRINVARYTTEINYAPTAVATQSRHGGIQRQQYYDQERGQPAMEGERPPEGLADALVDVQAVQQADTPAFPAAQISSSDLLPHDPDSMAGGDGLGAIPQTLLGPDFLDLDRIISFDDGTMFAATLDGSSGTW